VREREVDIVEELRRFRKNMWDHMQRNVGKILTSASLNKYKVRRMCVWRGSEREEKERNHEDISWILLFRSTDF
jgi:hypothetical protein